MIFSSKIVIFLFCLLLFFLLILTLELFLYLAPWVKISILSFLLILSVVFLYIIIQKSSPIYSKKKTFKGVFNTSIVEIFRNTFELIKSLKTNYYSEELTKKAIEERTEKLQQYVSTESFKKKRNIRTFKLFIYIVTIFLLAVIPFIIPTYNSALQRVIQADKEFSKPLPYSIFLENKDLSVFKNENLILKVKIEGEELPLELYIQYNSVKEKLQKTSPTEYTFEFTNIKQSFDFQLLNDEYKSNMFNVNVIEKPKILNYTISLNYPSYVGKQNEQIQNQNSILVPQGTQLSINLVTEGVDRIDRSLLGKSVSEKVSNNQLNISYSIINQSDIMITAHHAGISIVDSLLIQCNVITDEYPQLRLDISQDSLYDNILFFKGEASDDYGISNMFLNINLFDLDGKINTKKIKLPLSTDFTHIAIDEIINIENFYTNLPRKIELFIEVIDNDAIRNGKRTVSATKEIVFKTEEEKQKDINSKNDANLTSMKSMIAETNKIEKELENVKKAIQETNKKDWNTQKKMEALKKRMDELKQKIDALNQQMNQINNFEKLSDEQKENKKNLEKELNEMLKKELENMMKSMEELMKQNNPNLIQNKLDDIKKDNENLKENLKKNVEQYKNMEFEKRFEQNISKLQDIIDKQNKLNQIEPTTANKEVVKKEQEEINKKFSEFQKEMDELRKLNSSLEEPNKLKDTQKEEQSIDNQLKNSSKQLENGKDKKAKESQKEAQKQMEELKDNLDKNKQEIEEDNIAEDIDQVREILENLVKISVDQEEVMKKFSSIKYYDPSLSALIKEQISMKENFEIIKDSLTAIAKRQPEVQAVVFKELITINQNFDIISTSLFDKKIAEVIVYQRYVMTSTNNLALFLAESLKKMKNKQSKMKSNSKSKKKGNNTCDNPGNSKKKKDSKTPNMEKIRKMQEGLNKKMPKPGPKPGGQMGEIQSEELARLAAQQEAIRRMLQQFLDNMKKEGQGYDGKMEKMMKDMEQTEKDIVNKKITQNTINRQQEILTRMLESEKAQNEREKEETRESKEGKQLISPTNKYLDSLQKKRIGQKELLKKMPIPLKMYYKDKVSKYFINFGVK